MASKPSERKKIPKEIIILGEVFKIKICAMEDKDGDCSVQERTIRLNEAIDLETQWRTLFHEIIHAYVGVTGLCHWLTSEQEEAICDNLELLYQIMELKI